MASLKSKISKNSKKNTQTRVRGTGVPDQESADIPKLLGFIEKSVDEAKDIIFEFCEKLIEDPFTRDKGPIISQSRGIVPFYMSDEYKTHTIQALKEDDFKLNEKIIQNKKKLRKALPYWANGHGFPAILPYFKRVAKYYYTTNWVSYVEQSNQLLVQLTELSERLTSMQKDHDANDVISQFMNFYKGNQLLDKFVNIHEYFSSLKELFDEFDDYILYDDDSSCFTQDGSDTDDDDDEEEDSGNALNRQNFSIFLGNRRVKTRNNIRRKRTSTGNTLRNYSNYNSNYKYNKAYENKNDNDFWA